MKVLVKCSRIVWEEEGNVYKTKPKTIQSQVNYRNSRLKMIEKFKDIILENKNRKESEDED